VDRQTGLQHEETSLKTIPGAKINITCRLAAKRFVFSWSYSIKTHTLKH